MTRVVLASSNAGKLAELQMMLADSDIELVSQGTLGVSPVEETGETFLENALLKARNAARQTCLPAIADDSGLEVDALSGAPGIHSARYAGMAASDADNLDKLLKELSLVPANMRTARFRCFLVYLSKSDDPSPIVCEGIWEGRILNTPRGSNGFGYDPVFLPNGRPMASAEMPASEKNSLSHRGQALRKLALYLASTRL